MIALLITVLVLGVALIALAIVHVHSQGGRRSPSHAVAGGRILFPFVGDALSADALDCALRLAATERCTLVPTFLARVSLTLPLKAALPRQGAVCLELQDAIEHRANNFGVSVDARVQRGRSHRHALREAIAGESYDRIVVAAAHANGRGIAADDVRWLLDNAPGEILVMRPGADADIPRAGAVRVHEPIRRHALLPPQPHSSRPAGARPVTTPASHGARPTGR